MSGATVRSADRIVVDTANYAESLEDRTLLSAVVTVGPNAVSSISGLIQDVLPVDSDSQLGAITNQLLDAIDSGLIYQAFPGETNDVSISGDLANIFLLANESSDVSLFRLGAGAIPPFTADFLDDFFSVEVNPALNVSGDGGPLIVTVGLGVDDIVSINFDLSELIKNLYDLTDARAISLNPTALFDLFPDLENVVDAIQGLLELDISSIFPDIASDALKFPALPPEDLNFGLFTIPEGSITPEFDLIPEFVGDFTELFDDIGLPVTLPELIDLLPSPIPDVVNSAIDLVDFFKNDFLNDSVYVSTLDRDDTIDLGNLTGIPQQLYAGDGRDTIIPGGGQAFLDLLLDPFNIDLFNNDNAKIEVFGEGGPDTIIVNRKFSNLDFQVDGGPGTDRLVVEAKDESDIVELVAGSDGNLEFINFLAPDPNNGNPTNEVQRITLPEGSDGGTFSLSFTDRTGVADSTGAISFDASASDVESALEGLSNIGAGNVDVSGSDGGPWEVEFTGTLMEADQNLLQADPAQLTRSSVPAGISRTQAGLPGGGTNEIQRISVPSGVTGGTFRLEFDGDTTGPLDYNASRSEVQTELEGLGSIGAGNVDVSGSSGGPWFVEFIGNLGQMDVSDITSPDDNSLTGGVGGSVVETQAAGQRVLSVTLPAPQNGNAELGGTFRLTFDNGTVSDTTGLLSVSASPADVQTALAGLASIDAGQVQVTGPSGGPYAVSLGGLAANTGNLFMPDASGLTGGTGVTVGTNTNGSGQNQISQVTITSATDGQVALQISVGGVTRTTAAIPGNAVPAEVQAALEALPLIGVGNVNASGSPGNVFVELTGDLATTAFAVAVVDDDPTNPGDAGSVSTTQSAAGGPNEQQTVTFVGTATGGDFTLTFNSETTDPIPFDASNGTVREALEDLPGLSVGDVDVTGAPGSWTVTFVGTDVAHTNLPQMTADSSNLSGGFANGQIGVAQTQAASNEQQTVTLTPLPVAGTFTLRYLSDTTTDLDFDATAAEVQTALENLPNIGTGNVMVTDLPGAVYLVEFTGELAARGVTLISANSSGLSDGQEVAIVTESDANAANEIQTVSLASGVTGGDFTLTFQSLRVQTTTEGDASNNEVQAVTLPGGTTGGTFTLSFGNQETGDLDFDATAADVQTALRGLPSIAGANVNVTGAAGGPYTVEFVASLANQNVELIETDGSDLTGSFTTSAIGSAATAGDVQSALEGLASIGAGNVSVSSDNATGGPWIVEFIGALEETPLELLTSEDGVEVLGGGVPTIEELDQGGSGEDVLIRSTRFTKLVSVEEILIEGGGGDDRLRVTGAFSMPASILYDAGDGTDVLELFSTDVDPRFVAPVFPGDDQAIVFLDNQSVEFTGVEGALTFDAGGNGGEVVVVGTDAGNELRFNATGAGSATVSNDSQVAIILQNFGADSAVTIQGAQGEDTISISPNNVTEFATFVLDGQGPSGANAVRFEGTTGADTLTYQPDPADPRAGQVTYDLGGGDSVMARFQSMSDVEVVGLFGDDSLTINEPLAGSSDLALFEPSVGNDGQFQIVSQNGGPTTVLPYATVTYSDIESRNFDLGTGSDTFSVSTDSLPGVNSSVSVSGGTGTSTVSFGDQTTTFTHDTTDADTLTLEIGTVVDDVTVSPGEALDIAVNAGVGPGLLTYNAVAAAVALDLRQATLNQAGVGSVTYTGITSLAVNASNQALTVTTDGAADTVDVTPLVIDGGQLTASSTSVQVTYSNAASLLVDGGGAEDLLRVFGLSGDDEFLVDGVGDEVAVTGRLNVDYVNFESLQVHTLDGLDEITVIPAANLPILINGGNPVGATTSNPAFRGDQLIIDVDGEESLIFHAGPEGDAGTYVIGARQPISFDEIESINLENFGPAPVVTVNGTNDGDEIRVTATGDQDFSVSVNGSPAVVHPDVPTLILDSIAGTDTIAIETRSNWDVDVTVNGGGFSTGDLFVLTTPGQETATFTPATLLNGSIVLTDAVSTIDLIGIQNFVYDGQDGNDTLNVLGDGGNNFYTLAPLNAFAEASLAISGRLGVEFRRLGLTGVVQPDGQGGDDTLLVQATGNDDNIDLAFPANDSADFDLSTLGTSLNLITTSVESYEIQTFGGDDDVNITASTNTISGTVTMVGGENGDGSDATTIDLGGGIFNATVRPNLPASDALLTGVGPDFPIDGFEHVFFTNGGLNDTLIVDPGTGDHTVRVDRDALAGFDRVTSDSLPTVSFEDLSVFRLAPTVGGDDVVTFATRNLVGADVYQTSLGATDTLVIEGSAGDGDDYRLSNSVGVSNVTVIDNNNPGFSLFNTTGTLAGIVFNTLGGDDDLTVDVNSADSDVIDVPITFDGGNGSDLLTVTGAPATTVDEVVYRPGPATDAGRLAYENGANVALMTIDFLGLEPILDNVVAATLTVNGTAAAETINYDDGVITPGTNGRVTVDRFESVEFSNKTNLTINALAGDDTVNLNNPNVPTGLTTINVNGGDPTGGDTVHVDGTTGADTFTYTGTSNQSGTLVRTAPAGATTYNITTSTLVTIDGGGGTDALEVTTPHAQITPDTTPGAGLVEPFALTGGDLLPINYANIADVDVLGTTAVVEATDANDQVTLTAAGLVQVTNNLGFDNEVDVSDFATLIINLLGGDDAAVNAVSDAATGITSVTFLGGDSGSSDVVTENNVQTVGVTFPTGQTNATGTRTAAAGGGSFDSTYVGIETVRLNGANDAGNPTDFDVSGYGLPTTLQRLELAGGGDANDTIDVSLTAGPDTLSVTPTGTGTSTLQRVQGGPEIDISGFNNADNNLSVDAGGGPDEIVLIGTAAADTVTVIQGGVGTRATLNPGTKWVPIDFTGTEQLTVTTSGGNDTLDVDNTNGSVNLSSGINYSGGLGDDLLRLIGTTTVTSSTYNVGPAVDAGAVIHENPAGTVVQAVYFEGLEPVIDIVPAADLTVNATNSSNNILYSAGANSGGAPVGGVVSGQVAVDNFETIEFANKTTLIINGLAGDDVIDTNHGATPADLTGITVSGGNATGGDALGNDQLHVNGTVADVLTIATDTSVITNAEPVPITYGSIERITVVEGISTDLQVSGSANYVVTPNNAGLPGSGGDRGTILTDFLPIDFLGYGSGDTITLLGTAAGTDTLRINGTFSDDAFDVATGGDVTIASRATIDPGPGVTLENLTLGGFDGLDVFTVAGGHLYTTISLEGGAGDDDDVLDANTPTGPVTVDVGNSTVNGYGGTISYTGLESIFADAGDDAITFEARDLDDIVGLLFFGSGVQAREH